MSITVDKWLAVLATQIGTVETPPNSNCNPYSHELGRPCERWCADFVAAMAKRAGLALPSFSASTQVMRDAFRQAGSYGSIPKRGALAFWQFDQDPQSDHVSVVESLTATTITTIDGNTSPDEHGSQANGGGVYRRTRQRSLVLGYGYPAFEEGTMGIVLDFAGTPPVRYPVEVSGVMRYVAPRLEDGSRRRKCVTPMELAEHLQAGRSVGFVFEDSASNSLRGLGQGSTDGKIAVAELRELGVPAGVAIYAAIDRDIAPSEMGTVAGYLSGFHKHSLAAGYRRGVYGEYDVVVQMLTSKTVDLGWQTVAWSNKQRAQGKPGVALYQRAQQMTVGGTTCDVNEVWAEDWGQFRRPESVSAPSVTAYPEAHMQRIDAAVTVDQTGHGYVDLDVKASQVVSVVFSTVNPPGKGYKAIPDWARLDVGGKARIVVEEAIPSTRLDISVWAVTN